MITRNHNKRYKFINPLLIEVLSIFLTEVLQLDYESHFHKIPYWCEHIEFLIANRGLGPTIKRLKMVRLHVTRFWCGDPLYTNSENLRVDKSGIPSCLGPLKDLVHSQNPKERQLLLTFLILSRAIEGGHGEPDLSTITKPGVDLNWESYTEEIKMALKKLNIKSTSPPIWKDFHPSTKKGPNGQAVVTSLNDAHALKEDPELFEDILLLGGNPQLRTIIKMNQSFPIDIWGEFSKSSKTNLRKITSVADPEAKVRIIAIFDYWSQAVLLPLHDSLMEILRSLPSDRTFNQLGGTPGKPANSYWSLDLSSATDRFPLGFQQQIIKILYGDQYSRSWARVLTLRPFPNQWGDPVYYNAGQPMGAYSSWAAFTLSHHVLVHIAARRCGISNPDPCYQILGDDIVITNDLLAQEYIRLINLFGVEISSKKTHKSQDMFEFAKRWYWNGHEISGLPVRGILTVKQFWWHLLPEWKEVIARAGSPDNLMAPGIFSRILKITNTPLRFAERLYITHLLLASDKEGCRTGRQILRSWLFTMVGTCNTSDSNYQKLLNEHLVCLQAQSLEESLKALRSTLSEYTKQVETVMAKSGFLNNPLLTYQVAIAPLAIITRLFREAKNRLQGLKEGSYSTTEIVEMAGNTLNVNPLSLLHERKKHLKARSQTDLTKKVIHLSRTEDYIRRRLTACSDEEVSTLFIKQQSVFPSWKKDRVSWTHIMHLEARRQEEWK